MSEKETTLRPIRWESSSSEVLGAKGPIDSHELAMLARTCTDANGVPLREADYTWRKTWGQFAAEGQRSEIIVMPVYPDPINQPAVRRLAKTSLHKVETFIYAPPYEIVEVGRTFLLTGEYVPTTSRKGMRGTGRRGEPIKEEAVREVIEELGGRIPLTIDDLSAVPGGVSPLNFYGYRDSTVYRHILANDLINRFEAFVESIPWERLESEEDEGVIVHFERRPIPAELLERIVRKRESQVKIVL